MAKDKNSLETDKEIDLKKYDDPSGLSLEEMNFGLWLSEHRPKFIKALIIFLIILSAGLFIYSSYNYVIYLMSGNPASLAITNLVNSPRQVAADLVIAPTQVFMTGDQADLATLITNPNAKFTATFSYCFQVAGQNVDCGQSYILPGDNKYIMALGKSLGSGAVSATLQVSNIFWQRIDGHKIPDWAAYSQSRLNLPVSAINFSPAAQSGLSNQINLNSLTFTVANQTAYSYYQVPLDILLFNGSQLIGVNRYYLENFLTGTSRNVKLVWPGDLNGVSQTQIVPDLNILDNSIYLPYSDAVQAAGG